MTAHAPAEASVLVHTSEKAHVSETVPASETMITTAETTTRAMRADAKRNYDALLAAAAEVFQEHGVDASLEEIAKRAGVGIGTLYRHFPNRNVLVEAVYRREVELLAARADELLAHTTAEQALAQWMRGFVAYVALKRGMADALKAASEAAAAQAAATGTQAPDLFAPTRVALYSAADRLLAAAVAEHAIRDDVTSTDLIRAMGGICLANDQPNWQDQAGRLVDLLMDGLRFGARNSQRR